MVYASGVARVERLFIEMPQVQQYVDSHGGQLLLEKIQATILKNPHAGAMIQGTGGLRKVRLPDVTRERGTRGGHRLIYLDLAQQGKTYLLRIYPKATKITLSPSEKKQLRAVVATLKQLA